MLHVLVGFCASFLAIYLTLRYYLKTTVWCRSQTCLIGKTAIVTGANTGIGYETALDFAKRGARVILACRDEAKAERARYNIIEATGNKNIIVKIVNFASFESVRSFAEDIKANESRLDILVNNAGAGGMGDKKSKDGHLLIMQVNYFSSFLLTHLLIGLLKKTAPSRIINVSSLAAKYAKLNLENLDKHTGIYVDYSNSKLCNICFTIELAKRLKGSGVTTYSLHPGACKTEIFRRIDDYALFQIFKQHFFKTCEEGAQTSIYTAVAKGIEGLSGEHFDNCKRVEPYKTVENVSLHKKVWEKTLEIVQLTPEEIQI